jgi:hypothetical protein
MDAETQAARRKAALRWVLRLGAALAVGAVCPLLPAEKQLLCHFAAKVLAIFGGGG